MFGAKYVSNSCNGKISGSIPVDATYLSIQQTCPKTCQLRNGGGCYAEDYPLSVHIKRLDIEAEELSSLDIARAEAKLINESYGGGPIPNDRNLRLHVSGDSRTIAGTKVINKACGRWLARGDKSNHIWSYTHCWQNITRDNWSNVSIFASVDSIDQVEYARQNGYAPTIVVPEHLKDKPYLLKGSDVKWIPCCSQIGGIGCVDCRLCFQANKLYAKNMGISFAAHGIRKSAIKTRLNQR